MKKILFIILLFSTFSTFGNTLERKDTLDYKFGIGYNTFPGLMNLEAGLNFEFKLKKNIFFQFSYVHFFKGFNYPETGGSKCRGYVPTYGELIKLGIRKYYYKPLKQKFDFIEYRVGYKNSNTPKYTSRDGSCGLSLISYTDITIHMDSYRTSFIIGSKKIYSNNFYIEKSLGFGVDIRNVKKHSYYGGPRGGPMHIYPENSVGSYVLPWPLLEVSFLIGFGL